MGTLDASILLDAHFPMIRISKSAIILAIAMMSLYVLTAVTGPSLFLTNSLIAIAPLLAGLACLWRGRRKPSVLADKWRLMGLGLLIWSVGQGWYTYATLVHDNL